MKIIRIVVWNGFKQIVYNINPFNRIVSKEERLKFEKMCKLIS